MMKIFNYPFIFLIKVYKFFLSPFFYNSCRFNISCSTYALECFKNYNVIKAFFKSLLRILKCNPWFNICDSNNSHKKEDH